MVDHLFEALSNRYRRRLLIALVERESQTELSIPGAVREQETESEMKDVHIAMVQNHLPKLEETGLIRWDRDADVVTRGPQFDEIAPLVQLLLDHDDELPGELTE